MTAPTTNPNPPPPRRREPERECLGTTGGAGFFSIGGEG